MSGPTTNQPEVGRPVHLWIALLGGLVIGAGFAVPCTRLGERTVTPWELVNYSERAVDEMEQQRDKMNQLPPPPPLPVGGPGPFRAKIEEKKAKLKGSLDLTESIFQYTRWGLLGLLACAALQVVPPLLRGTPGLFAFAGWFSGFAGLAFLGTLGVLAVYLGEVKLFDQPLPILTGYWIVTGGTAVLLLAGLLSLTRKSWFIALPLQLLPGAAWSLYFKHLLGV